MLCLIIPLSNLGLGGGAPSHPIVLPPDAPPGVWPPGVPTHPIYTPPATGIWPGLPSHPIAPGGPPPGVWPSPPSPGHPAHPIVIPPGSGVHPSHPIYTPAPTPPAGQEGYYLAYIPALGQWVYIPVGTTKPPEAPSPEPKA
jgi:hypothetical protein